MAKKVQKLVKRKKSSKTAPKKQKRKTTARDANKRPALERRFYSKIKQQYFDADYIDKLDEVNKDYYNSFLEETLNAKFNHNGKKLIKNTKEKRKIYSENNSRNRDVYNVANAIGRMIDICPEVALETWQENNLKEYEETQEIQIADLKAQESELLTKKEFLKLLKSGAKVPKDVVEFYEALYSINVTLLRNK